MLQRAGARSGAPSSRLCGSDRTRADSSASDSTTAPAAGRLRSLGSCSMKPDAGRPEPGDGRASADSDSAAAAAVDAVHCGLGFLRQMDETLRAVSPIRARQDKADNGSASGTRRALRMEDGQPHANLALDVVAQPAVRYAISIYLPIYLYTHTHTHTHIHMDI